MHRLFEDIQYLKGVGPKRAGQLRKLGIESVFDLLWYVPRTYFNRSNPDKIRSLTEGENGAIRARVISTGASRTRRGLHIFKALLQDDTGMITAVWFNQPYLSESITSGQELFLTGRVRSSSGMLEFNVSEHEALDDSSGHIQVIPVYALTDGLSQKVLRGMITRVLNENLPFYSEILPQEIKKEYDLCDIAYAFYNIHYPNSGEDYLRARKRLALEELILFQLSLRQEERNRKPEAYVRHLEQSALVSDIVHSLPFALTAAQQKVIREIHGDMESPLRMNRLLQGDVGSGKTVIAALAMAKAVSSGYQAAIMAPTEILAEQHYLSLSRFFQKQDVILAVLTGSTSAGERRMILQALALGQINILVGTHALIQEDVHFSRLGLAVIDEQHRFGVKQRALLGLKGDTPDVLVMTATPIPRTLALTVYGDLSVSIIDEVPPGRKPIKTRFVKNEARRRVYDFVRSEITLQKAQVYIVCPLVEESEKQDLQAAVSLYEELRCDVFPEFHVGLIHGRLKTAEKDFIMERFKRGEIQILVSTTVIEVGVDVPSATIMAVMHAERFGLSQLHQLRGRVGRGERQSYCFLIGDPRTEDGFKRLRIMEKTGDGFKLAQYDLALRGPGEFWGVKQHGLNQLKVASLVKDQKWIEMSQQICRYFIPEDKTELEQYISKKFKKSDSIAEN